MRHARALHPSQPRLLPSPRLLPLLLIAALVALVTVPLVGVSPAQAASYRYWGYYHGTGKGSWAFASTGPAAVKPADGAVEGWRFAISGDADSRYPRVTSTFAAVCAGTTAVAGKKRVAVYIDSGIAVDAPTGSTPPAPAAACALVPTAATGAQVLAAVEKVRASKGLVCGIGGYPSTGCGGEVKKPPAVPSPEPKVAFAGADPTPTTTPSATPDVTTPTASAAASTNAATGTQSGSHTYVFVLVAVAAALVLGGGGLFVARRSRS
ncbi:MAG TPA: SCO2322 family protein [Actinopolymorphaceae bacterium]|jgi:hypothetical protein